MATLASFLQLEKHELRFDFLVEELHHPIYDSHEIHVICTLFDRESSYCSGIYSYLHDGIIPETFNLFEHRKLIQNLSPFPYLW